MAASVLDPYLMLRRVGLSPPAIPEGIHARRQSNTVLRRTLSPRAGWTTASEKGGISGKDDGVCRRPGVEVPRSMHERKKSLSRRSHGDRETVMTKVHCLFVRLRKYQLHH